MRASFGLTDFQIKIFFGSFIAIFVIVTLQFLKLAPDFLIKPIPEPDALSQLLPKLSHYSNTYHLQKDTPFIAKAHAGAAYEDVTSYALIDFESGKVLKEKALSERVAIASLTKIMTTIVALDLADKQESFVISKRAERQVPTKIGVIAGERMQLSELLKAVMLTSANDAAQAVSDGIDQKYREPVFIRAMNKKAEVLGLSNTHFTNPQGFDSRRHYSSVEDLAILTHYAMKHYPYFAEIVSEDYAFLQENAEHKQFDLYNWNGLIGVYPNVSGVKIGNTDDAGRATLVTAERGGKTLLVVLTGAPGILERDLWAAQLLDEGFSETLGLEPVKVTEEALRAKYATWVY